MFLIFKSTCCFNKSFQQGWVYFGSSLYFISSTKLPWLQSRDDCQQRGVFDFMLKNFMGKFHRLTWIGLTHKAETMKWNWNQQKHIFQGFNLHGLSSCNESHV
uniref:C-type lectin domain-containing protein n=1 Tax=Oryzias sinensis TaxID=183150 RepID=A0A8C7Y1F7_9TELE